MEEERGVPLEFRVLGPLEVTRDGEALPFRGTREQALLVLLILNANRTVAAERLTEELWAGEPPEGAIRSLRVYVSRLRQALGPAGQAVVTRPSGYVLQVAPETVDAVRFEALVARGRDQARGGDHDRAARTFREALTLWRGPALADVADAPFARAEATRMEEARVAAVEDRIDADLACGRHGELTAELEALTGEHPFRERLWSQRIVALYRSGRQADALRAYRQLRVMLGEELGIEPSSPLQQLEDAVLRHDPALDLHPTGERVATAPGRFPPPLVRRERLPLVGREVELSRLDELWQATCSGQRHLVLVAGEPGIGKSRLAAEFAGTAHGAGAPILFGRCDEGMGVPYQPFVEALGRYLRQGRPLLLGRLAGELVRLVPDVAERVDGLAPLLRSDPETERYRLFDAVAAWLSAMSEPAPVVLVVEDLHWATKPTLLLLSHLLRSDEDLRLLVVVTFRDTPLDMTPDLADLVAELLRLPGVERLRLAGLDEPGVGALSSRSWPALGFHPERTPFVGRSSEREMLSASLQRARASAGGMVLIGGEPGIGKTRLAEEVATEAIANDMAVFTGHSYEMAGASAYVSFVEILEGALASASSPEAFRWDILGDAAPEVARLLPRLRRLFPDLPAPFDLPPEQERQYLFTCLSDVLTRLAIARPTLLVLDDLQWADESTLLFLEQMAAQLAHLPLLVVATYRDVEVGRPLARTFEDLHRRRLAQRIKLGALSLTETAQSVAALAGQEPPAALVAGLHDATEGNIFFLEEVFRDLLERGALFERPGTFRTDLDLARLDVPEGVRIVIDRRLDRLSDGARRLLALAAVAGRAFPYRLLQALGDGDSDAVLDILDEAERAMLVRAGRSDGEFLFAHELIRQTLVAGFSGPRRARAHLRAAEATITLHAGQLDEHAAEIAHHLDQAGDEADPKQLFTYSLLAGQRALSTSAFAEALGHLERAAGLQAVALPRERADLFFALGGAERRMGHVERALSAWESSISEYELLGDDEATGRACVEVGLDLASLGRWEEAIATYTRGLTALGDRVSHDRVRLLARLGTAVSYGDPVAGDGMFAEALRLTDEIGDDYLRAFVFGEMAFGLNSSARSAEVVRTGLIAADGLRRAGDLWGLALALSFVEVHLPWTGRLAEVTAIDEELVPLAERIGNHIALMLAGRGRAQRDFFPSGRPDVLEAVARSDLEFNERMGWPWAAHAYTGLGMAQFLRGDWEAAEVWFRRGSDNAPAGVAGLCWGWWFQYLAFAGREQEALRVLDEHRSELPTPGQPNTWTAWSLLMAFTEGLFVLDRREEPAAWYPLIVEGRATGALVIGQVEGWLLERVAGIAATAAAHYDAAEAHFLLALRQADEIPHQFERLETRRFYAQMLTERSGHGDLVRARQMLDDAVEGYTRLGMPRHRDLANAALAAIAP